MYRFRNHRLIKLYSNGFQSLLMQTKYQRNANCFALNSYSTQSDAIDVSKMVIQSSVSKNLGNYLFSNECQLILCSILRQFTRKTTEYIEKKFSFWRIRYLIRSGHQMSNH